MTTDSSSLQRVCASFTTRLASAGDVRDLLVVSAMVILGIGLSSMVWVAEDCMMGNGILGMLGMICPGVSGPQKESRELVLLWRIMLEGRDLCVLRLDESLLVDRTLSISSTLACRPLILSSLM